MVQLYPYQRVVKELVQSGQSVILQAPTGAGKTRAALAPYIEAFFDFPAEQFPKKCIYSVPMRTLANQFNAEYVQLAASYKRRFDQEINVTIQTGDRPEDPKLEGDLIFTTIDQTLSNFLAIPYALSNRQANLNAGAIISSYLVFDEFHLFPPQALATTLAMLKLLKEITPFVLMTATFSNTMLAELSRQLNATIVPQPEERRSFQALPSQQKERRYYVVPTTLDATAVLKRHPTQGRRRSIAICNTVKRVQDLFEAVNALKPADTEVMLLHSRFFKDDRKEKEAWIQREFGKDDTQYQAKSAILIATQVIEVGLDITSDVFHTELAPANAVLQRAGRCARYQGETGEVYIYQVPMNDEGRPLYHPYHDKIQSRLCETTWQAFTACTDAPLSFVEEQALLSTVHEGADQQTLQKLEEGRHTHREKIQDAMGFQDRQLAHELIRDVDSRAVIVHPNPNEDTYENEPERLKSPWRWQSFSLYRGTVFGAFKELDAQAEDAGHDDWVMMRLVPCPDTDATQSEEEEGYKVSYKWERVYNQQDLEGALLVAVHPRFARYTKEVGFQIGMFNDTEFPYRLRDKTPNRDDRRFTYRQETYLEHIEGLYKAYRDSWKDEQVKVVRQPLSADMAYVFSKIEQQFGLLPGTYDRVARFIIAGHDLGKLGQGWQQWVHRWQEMITSPVSAQIMLAHTDYDGSTEQDKLQKQLRREIGPRPPHAAESAYGLQYLTVWLTDKNRHLFQAINTAIARHHTATHRGEVQAFRVSPQAKQAFQEALALVGLPDLSLANIKWSFEADTSLRLVEADKLANQMLPYFLLARVLRLADQRSQQ